MRLPSPGSFLGALAALSLCAAASACFIKSDPNSPNPEGRPCATDRDCPQPQNACQVWTCYQEVCTAVAAARDTVLPKEAQVAGDCKILVCDGQGKSVAIADKTDEPAEDDNPCAEEACEDGQPAYPAVAVGTPCGKSGVCNGKGKCGVCLPEAQKCDGNTPATCSEDGAWVSQGACPAASPICSGASCIGIEEIAAGDSFSCGRLADGKVRCFGEPDGGKLGQQGARRISGLSGVVQVAAGGEHTCALMADQTVKCWGSNAAHQLGDDTKETRNWPAPVPRVSGVAQIAAGGEFTCARLADGTAVCWGANDTGQLGTGPATHGVSTVAGAVAGQPAAHDRPTEVIGLDGAVQLSLGRVHACARLSDSGVACWGNDVFGALGLGSPPPPPPPKTQAVPQPHPGTPIKPGGHPGAPIKPGGGPHPGTPGGPHPGGLAPHPMAPIKAASGAGTGSSVGTKSGPPLPAVKGLRDVVEVAAGAQHACARLKDGSVMCWGDNHRGQLGDGTTKAKTAPVKVKDLTNAVALALGGDHSCALLADGSVRCWGAGAKAQLGDPGNADHAEPFAVPGLSGATSLSSGAEHLCARMADGTYLCWGANESGELGSGAAGDKPAAILW
jgi:alpha-tubulin suppressor-like RCC1 family protein